MASYIKKLRDERRNFARERLGNKCVRCGSTKKLHFDHIDPSTKLYNIALILHYRLETLISELDKCQLLCSSCHGKKTTHDRGFNTPEHGTLSMYMNQRCRCDMCKAANAEYTRHKRLQYA